MEDEQRISSSSTDIKPLTFAEWADELCPQYMALGVPYNEFWHGDYTQLRFYADAYRLRIDHENYNAWLQGAYIYDALCAVSPVLNAFAKRGTKPSPYHEKPYSMKNDAATNDTTEKKSLKTSEEIQAINASAKFASFMTQWNKRFESKGGETHGSNNRPTAN